MTPRITPNSITKLHDGIAAASHRLETHRLKLHAMSSGDYRAADEAKVRALANAEFELKLARRHVEDALQLLGDVYQ